jgi:hypothetical protein
VSGPRKPPRAARGQRHAELGSFARASALIIQGYAINVHTLSRRESTGRDWDKMSSFTYDGPRNVLCTRAPMSRDVCTQPTPEPTPIIDVDSERSSVLRANRQSVGLDRLTR